jgi:hypothetical protein
MNKYRKFIITGITILSFTFLAGISSCDPPKPTSDLQQSKKTEQLMQEADRQVGMPNIMNFQQKKMMKMIYELTDKEDLITYAYIKSDYKGKLYFIGKCIGYGVPFSAQYTNPEKIADMAHSYGYAILPQPDPNGLFMPTSSSATWLMMLDPETNKPRPVYVEPEIVVSPFKLPNAIY